MVRFGEQLQTEEVPEWQREYIDYEMLKEHIDDLVRLKEDPKAHAAFDAKRNIFQGLLDEQISKVSLLPIAEACRHMLYQPNSHLLFPAWLREEAWSEH